MIWFGAAYAIASLSCTLAVLLAVIAQATATANPLQLLGVFAGYGLGAASVLIALSITVALAKATVARAMRKVLPIATRLGAVMLVLSGIYLIGYWLPTLTGDRRGPSALGGLTEGLSSQLTTFLGTNQGLVAAVAGALLILSVAALALQRRRDRRSAPPGAELLDDCCRPQEIKPSAGEDEANSARPSMLGPR
jgi:cytochrome c-type biogenesis protein